MAIVDAGILGEAMVSSRGVISAGDMAPPILRAGLSGIAERSKTGSLSGKANITAHQLCACPDFIVGFGMLLQHYRTTTNFKRTRSD
jgi:hypothetical protein